MTLYYQTNSWTSQPQPTEKTVETWKHASTKANWRIVQLPNGFYQTEIKVPDDDSCLLYTSPSPRDRTRSRMPSSA